MSLLLLVTCIQFTSGSDEVNAATKTYTYGSYKYTVSNKTATIIKYTGTASKVTIPSKVNGYPVVAIAK